MNENKSESMIFHRFVALQALNQQSTRVPIPLQTVRAGLLQPPRVSRKTQDRSPDHRFPCGAASIERVQIHETASALPCLNARTTFSLSLNFLRLALLHDAFADF